MSFKDIHFDFDQAAVRPDEMAKINDVVTFLKQNPAVQVRIDGHADPRGANAYNMALSQRRVSAVRDQLIKAGVPADRIQPSHFGKGRPKCNEATEACWQLDRRVEVMITNNR